MLDFRILGPLDVRADGRSLDLGSPKQRALLTLLVISAGRTLTTDRILEALWGDEAGGKEQALWVYVSRLRAVLEPDRPARGESTVLVTREHGYALAVDLMAVDAVRFEDAVHQARRTLDDDPEAAAAALAAALEEWRGSALQDVAYEQFARSEAERLDQLRLDATADRIEADLRCGRAREVIGELEALHRAHPSRERFVGQLMLALYRSGRHVDALRAYRGFRRRLREETGLDPSPGLARLEERILVHDDALQGPPHLRAATPIAVANPFRGLRAFADHDAAVFHGRERLVAEVLRRIMGGEPLIALVGPSGSGKSSIVGAGIVPAVSKLTDDETASWLVAWMVPGAHPYAELEATLRRATLDPPSDLGALLADPVTGVLRAVLAVLPDADARVLLVIDQFEELFSPVVDRQVRDGFLDQLVTLVDDPRGRVVIVLTLRADFYPRPLEHAAFGSRLGDGVVNVVPLRPDELESAAQRPAAQVGVRLEPALLASLLADVVGRPGALPLFQFALTELFEGRSDDVLTLASYEAVGGVAGAVAARADDLFEQLSDVEQTVATQLFLRLVTIADDDAWTRRRARVSEMTALQVDVVALERVIERYATHRLLTLDREEGGAPTVEIAHEALLTQWPRLRRWIEQARDDIRRHAALTTAMTEWERADRDPGYLLGGTRLRDAEQWAETTVMGLTAAERAYLDESVRVRDREAAREAERLRSERRLAASARRRLWAVATLIGAVVIAGGAVLVTVVGSDGARVVALMRLPDEQQTLVAAGLERVSDELGVSVEHRRGLSADPAGDYASLAEDDAQIVFIDPTVTGSAIEEVIATHPETLFVAIGARGPPDGAYPVRFADEQAGYLAGVAAGAMTRTRVVGFVGDRQDTYHEQLRAGFEAGMRRLDEDGTIVAIYLGDPGFATSIALTRANAAADELYARGADVVFAAAGEASTGVFESAFDRTLITGRDVWTIGAESEWRRTAPTHLREQIRASVRRRLDVAIFETVRAALDGEPSRDGTRLTAPQGALAITTDTNPQVDAAVDAAMDDLRRGVVSVPTVPTGGLTAPPDVQPLPLGTVTWDGQSCTADLDGRVAVPGDTVQIDFVNRSASPHALLVAHRGLPSVAPAEAHGQTSAYAVVRQGTVQLSCRPLTGGELSDGTGQPAATVDVGLR